MKKFFLYAGIGVFSFAFFAGLARAQVSSVSIDDLLRQLQQLQTLASQLKSQVEARSAVSPVVAQPSTSQASELGVGSVRLDELPGSPVVSCSLPVLQSGSTGNPVYLLQMTLNKRGYYPEGLVTGYYGRLTAAAVSRFQYAMGLPQIGTVDDTTASFLDRISPFAECGSGSKGPLPEPIPSPIAIPLPTPTSTPGQAVISGISILGMRADNSVLEGSTYQVVWNSLPDKNALYDITLLSGGYSSLIVQGIGGASFGCEDGQCSYAWRATDKGGFSSGLYQILIEGGAPGKGGRVSRGTSNYFTVRVAITTSSPVVVEPAISYVQSPMEDRNVIASGVRTTIYGTNLNAWGSELTIWVYGKAYAKAVAAQDVANASLQFVVPSDVSSGSYTVSIVGKGSGTPQYPVTGKASISSTTPPSSLTVEPVISYVQSPMEDRNVIASGAKVTIYGTNLNAWGSELTIWVYGKAYGVKVVAAQDVLYGSLQFVVPSDVSNGSYTISIVGKGSVTPQYTVTGKASISSSVSATSASSPVPVTSTNTTGTSTTSSPVPVTSVVTSTVVTPVSTSPDWVANFTARGLYNGREISLLPLTVGMRASATNQFDVTVDNLAPPPHPDLNYPEFYIINSNHTQDWARKLAVDIRAIPADVSSGQTWQVTMVNNTTSTWSVSWVASSFPSYWNTAVLQVGGTQSDLRTASPVSVPAKSTVSFSVTLKKSGVAFNAQELLANLYTLLRALSDSLNSR